MIIQKDQFIKVVVHVLEHRLKGFYTCSANEQNVQDLGAKKQVSERFAIVDNNGNDNYEISEMFVLNNYKRKKIGEKAVTKIFDMYKGNWTIKAVPSSLIAENFWTKTVNNYTNGNFKIEHTGKYARAELYFNNK